MPRFGSITSPASYRPSYSGGTYRSAGIKREAPLVTSYTSRYSTLPSKETVREVSPAAKKAIGSKYGATTNENTVKSSRFASTGNLSSTKSKTVDLTPSRLGRPAITVSRARSRNPSPLSSVSRSRSRDPSPAEPPKDRFVSSSSGYALPSSYNKLYTKSPSYGNKLSLRTSGTRGISPSPALSYMTASDTSVRIMKRQTEKEERSLKTSAERSPPKELQAKENHATEMDMPVSNKPIEMVEVTVVTRGTSPTLCPTTNYSRTRRIDVAKTIEKTIMRPRKKAQSEDKEVQSDRMDDTSKYCRFNSARAPTPWSPYLESKLSYGRYNNSSSSVSPSKTPLRESPENGEKSPSKSRESSVTSKSSSASSRSSVALKTASTPTKTSKSKSQSPSIALTKQKSPSTKSLPPPAPKSESPSKTSASSTSNGSTCSTKWANKDFRKSALNVGPTDRPRKMRHSSVDTDSEENRSDDAQRKSMSPLHQQPQRFERSPSVSSEMSGSSGNNTTNTNEIAKVFGKIKLSGVGIAANAMNSEKTKATNKTPHANESYAKNETKSPSPMSKIFTNSSSFVVGSEQRSQSYDANRNEDDVISICEHIERIAIEGALDQTNPTTKTTQINRNNNHNFTNHIVDETTTTTTNNINNINNSNWLLNSTDDQATTSTSGDNSTCQFFINLDKNNALNMKNKLRHIDSGELPWWMTADEDDDTIADDLTLNQTESETQPSTESNDDTGTTNWSCPPNEPNRLIEEEQAPKSMYRVTRIRSGERAWWMQNDGNDTDEHRNGTDSASNHEPMAEVDSSANYTFKIKRIESGEKAWWMSNDDPSTENTENTDFWSEINEKNETERNYLEKNRRARNYFQTKEPEKNFDCGVNDSNEGPPGHRASPEGLEDFSSNRRGLSPYAMGGGIVAESFAKNSANKLFISRHQNIDDLLGGTSHTMNSMRLERFENSAPLEEILPTQVRIHDGTAHTSYMQYIGDDRSDR